METAPPPPTAGPPLSSAINTSASPVAVIPTTFADSIDSSPRSRHTDSWDDPAPAPALHSKLRLMCSYGGTIFPRPQDKVLSYIGGDTRMVVVDRHTSLASLYHRLSNSILHGRSFTLKYQLPSEEFDSLISVTTDEDLENMIEEYDRTCSQTTSSSKSSRIRLFLFPLNLEETPVSSHSVGPIINNSTKSDEWFLNVLNGSGLMNRGFSDSSTNVNCLLGLDDDLQVNVAEAGLKDDGTGSQKNMNLKSQDVLSVPGSPMLETNSSFGSTSSSPSLANLPPIRVRPEYHREPKLVGIEEQFTQFTLTSGGGGGGVKQQDEGFVALPRSPPMQVGIVVAGGGLGLTSGVVPGEYTNRGFSDDERSDHGAPNRKPAAPQSLPQGLTLQNQQKSGSGNELASPDSISSDSSFTNPLSLQKPMLYQDPVVQISSGTNRAPANPVDPNTNPHVPMQQPVQDSAYILQQPQFDQQQQQQQFLHAGGAHYIQHHPTGAVPISAYYPVYPSQQQTHHRHHTQNDQQYPLYYVPVSQAQAYNMPVQQPSMSEVTTSIPSSHPQTTLAYNPMKNPPTSKPDVAAAAGVYRMTATGTPQLVQVPNNQHQQQYMGYSHIHHPSQSVAPTSATTAAYAYEFIDPTRNQIYYTQPLPPKMPSQHQTMTAASAVVLPDANSQLPADNVKPQVRTSQPI